MGKCSESDGCGFLITILLKQSDQTNNQEKDLQRKVSQSVCLCELNFMRWPEASWIRWHQLTPLRPQLSLKALGPRCFPIPKKPIGSRQLLAPTFVFLHHLCFLTGLPGRQQTRLDGYLPADLVIVQRSTIFQNAPLFPTVPSCPARGTRPRSWIQQRWVLASLT